MDTLEALFDHSSALVFGIGGSGDIVTDSAFRFLQTTRTNTTTIFY